MASIKTKAADQFTDSILAAWDGRGQWAETAQHGLCEEDADALAALCRETGEDYETAEAEVLQFVHEHLGDE